MPRKKLDNVPPTAEEQAPQPAKKPARASRAKKPAPTPEPESVAQATAAPVADEPTPEAAEPSTVKAPSGGKPKSRSKKKTEQPAAEATPDVAVTPALEPEPSPEEAVAAPLSEESAPPLAEPQKKKRPSRSKGGSKKAQEAVAEPAPEVEPVVAEVPEPVAADEPPVAPEEPRGRRSRSRRKKTQDEPSVEPTRLDAATDVEADAEPVEFEAELNEFGEDLPIPTWRPRQAAKVSVADAPGESADAQEHTADAPESSSDRGDDHRSGRRSRRRRRDRRGTDAESEAPDVAADAPEDDEVAEIVEAPVTAAPTPSTIRIERRVPAPEVKPRIAIPAEAPQIVVREGIPTLVRNHRVYPPIMFFGSPADERRANTVLEEVRMAAESGVHLFSFLIDLEVNRATVDESAAFAAYMLAKTVAIDPQAQVVFRVVFQAPRGWQDYYADARYRTLDGTLAEPSVCDDEFWGVARTCLEQFVQKMRLLELRDNILGVHLERGEWFLPEGTGYDTSRAAHNKFRDWARTRYLNDEVTLRASWFDGSVRFDNLQIPEYQPEGTEGEKFVRSSRKQRRYVDYHLFLSDATVQRIGDLAYAAKAASDGNFLVGVSYGYTFEWSHPASGHLALGKLLRTEEVDFVAGPPSYRNREPGGTAPFPGPIDSFALNGKLYISEEDFKTSLSIGHEPDDFNPALKTPQALESVHWRGAGAALAHAGGMAWMDLWGNGWLKTHSVWERAGLVQDALIGRMGSPLADPEVAIFIDERALAYLVDPNAFRLLVQNVRESVLRAGVSAAFYLMSDLAHREKFPESKLYVFLNAWDIRPDLRAAIKSRLQRDNKVLFWLYSAGMFDAGRDSLERAREVTGIALKPQPFYSKAGTSILNRRHPLSEAFTERALAGGTKLEPSYFAIPEDATVLGEYTQTGLPSFVVREFREDPQAQWTSVFLGEPLVNPALIRALAQMAGAHVWNFHEDVVHVRSPFLTVHCANAGPRTITLPNKFSAYNLVTRQWAGMDSPNIRFTAVDGSTHVFLVGPRVDIEHALSADPTEVLRMENLPPRDANMRIDSSNFDVPVMQLGEWMESGDQDEVADEWFLRPQQPVEEPAQAEESSDKVGRRRRRRRGRNGDREGSEETASARPEPSGAPELSFDDDLGMNVMFRKRD
jgi:hypothetical protein